MLIESSNFILQQSARAMPRIIVVTGKKSKHEKSEIIIIIFSRFYAKRHRIDVIVAVCIAVWWMEGRSASANWTSQIREKIKLKLKFRMRPDSSAEYSLLHHSCVRASPIVAHTVLHCTCASVFIYILFSNFSSVTLDFNVYLWVYLLKCFETLFVRVHAHSFSMPAHSPADDAAAVDFELSSLLVTTNAAANVMVSCRPRDVGLFCSCRRWWGATNALTFSSTFQLVGRAVLNIYFAVFIFFSICPTIFSISWCVFLLWF